ncbi:MAG: ribosome maturation factor RimP [Tissierellia bacterium]|nr:ribosome maturation factor RimP [Tissierellia bacterium]
MGRKNILKIVRENCEPIIEDLGYDLVDLEFVKESGDYFLRFYIGKLGGISIDDCQKVSEIISEKLDELDPIEQSYYLEVSSPGLDRPLKTDKDLKRNIGMKVELNLYKKIDGKKNYIGELLDFSDKDIVILMDNKNEKKISREYISNIKLVIEF